MLLICKEISWFIFGNERNSCQQNCLREKWDFARLVPASGATFSANQHKYHTFGFLPEQSHAGLATKVIIFFTVKRSTHLSWLYHGMSPFKDIIIFSSWKQNREKIISNCFLWSWTKTRIRVLRDTKSMLAYLVATRTIDITSGILLLVLDL